jgi:hypothetical protein
MDSGRKRFRLNVAGDFYVEDGCCSLCAVPGVTAPHPFGGFKDDGTLVPDVVQCWVKRQPSSTADLDSMIRTIATQDLGCIRYSGSDSEIIASMRELGEAEQVD